MTPRRLAYFGAVLGLLVVVQAGAQVIQLRRGFRLFSVAPQRVAMSWDMFAIRIDRCEVTFDPPLSIEGKAVRRWHDRGAPLEWDTVYNDMPHWETGAKAACTYKTGPTKIHLECATAQGEIVERSIDCP